MSAKISRVEEEEPKDGGYTMSKTLRRVLASIFDMAIMLLLLVICYIPALLNIIFYFNDQSARYILGIVVFCFLAGAVFAALYFAYHVALPSNFGGQTWGQKMFRIGYKTRKGGEPETSSYVIRSLTSLLLFLLTLGLSPIIDWIILGLGKTKRSFLDVMSDLVIVDYEDLIL